MSGVRTVDALRLGLGLGLLARPELALRISAGGTRPHEHAAARVLGARYVAQSGLGLGLTHTGGRTHLPPGRRRRLREADAAVDVIHAVSMVGLAVFSRRHRRVALLSAVTALGFAALDLQDVER